MLCFASPDYRLKPHINSSFKLYSSVAGSISKESIAQLWLATPVKCLAAAGKYVHNNHLLAPLEDSV